MNLFKSWFKGPTTEQLLSRNLSHIEAQLRDLQLVEIRLKAQAAGINAQLSYLRENVDTVISESDRDRNLSYLIHKGNVK